MTLEFCKLPNEILALIAKFSLPREKNAVARTSRYLHELLGKDLYLYNIRQEDGSAMYWAAQHGRICTMEKLRGYGAEVNDNAASRRDEVYHPLYPYKDWTPHDAFFTPLHVAAKFGQDTAVAWLLDHGARINAVAHNLCLCQVGAADFENDEEFDSRQAHLWTPLHIAICNGHLSTTKLLITRGADVQVCRSRDVECTALHTAARCNEADIIEFLLENELVDIDLQDGPSFFLGYSAVHLACLHFDKLSALEKLLEYDPDLEVMTEAEAATPFLCACKKGYFKAALLLLNHSANCTDELQGVSVMQLVAHNASHYFPITGLPETMDLDTWEDSREALVRRLLELGLGIDQLGGVRQTALHIAVDGPSTARTLELFLNLGANVEFLDEDGRTPLMLACEPLHNNWPFLEEKMEVLLRHGARLDTRSSRGLTPLDTVIRFARLSSDYSMVETLFQHASVGFNFAHGFLDEYAEIAFGHRRAQECRILCRNGAKPDLCKDEFQSGLKYTLSQDDTVMMRCCLEIFPTRVKPHQLLERALKLQLEKKDKKRGIIISLVAHADLDVHAHGKYESSLLHLACEGHYGTRFMQYLLDRGSDINAFDGELKTPLTFAIQNRCVEMVTVLLSRGADPFLRPTEEEWQVYLDRTRKGRGRYFIPIHKLKYDTPFQWALHFSNCGGPHAAEHKLTEETQMLEIILKNNGLPPLPDNPAWLSYLHAALRRPKVLDVFLAYGADPNSGSACLVPPILHALTLGRAVVMTTLPSLLQYGADVNQKNEKGESLVSVMEQAILDVANNTRMDAEFEELEVASLLVNFFRIVEPNEDTGEKGVVMLPEEELDRKLDEYLERHDRYSKAEKEKEAEKRRQRVKEFQEAEDMRQLLRQQKEA